MHRPSPLNHAATAAGLVAVLALLAGDAFAQYAVSQSPSMSLTPPTNISVMMDDSGSMQWAYVPDAFGACTGWRRFNAASFNGLAYNAATVYPSPIVLNSQGVAVTLTTCFSPSTSSTYNPTNYAHCTSTTGTGAWWDGFNQPATLLSGQAASAQNSVDLMTSYQPGHSAGRRRRGRHRFQLRGWLWWKWGNWRQPVRAGHGNHHPLACPRVLLRL
jgi:hypothetical protein